MNVDPRIVIFAMRAAPDGSGPECRFDVTTEAGRDAEVAKWKTAGYAVYSGPCESDIATQ